MEIVALLAALRAFTAILAPCVCIVFVVNLAALRTLAASPHMGMIARLEALYAFATDPLVATVAPLAAQGTFTAIFTPCVSIVFVLRLAALRTVAASPQVAFVASFTALGALAASPQVAFVASFTALGALAASPLVGFVACRAALRAPTA